MPRHPEAELIRRVVPGLSGPDRGWRQMARACAPEEHDRVLGEAEALHLIEHGSAALTAPTPAPERLRVVAWNVEYLKHLDASTERLRTVQPDLVLLSEVDLGMARSGNRHTAADLARELEMTHLYAAEFVELGSDDEQPTADDLHGLHGNAILSRLPILDPALIRLPSDGRWLTGRFRGRRRVGGRIALTARVDTACGAVGVVATHFESYGDPEERAASMRQSLEALDQIDPALPWLIGGDLNTNTVSLTQRLEAGWRERVTAEAPGRLVDPVPYEPLFREAEAHRYAWRDLNTLGVPTQRLHEDESARPVGRLDWFLARGLAGSEPVTLPALGADGLVLSDHEPIALTVALP